MKLKGNPSTYTQHTGEYSNILEEIVIRSRELMAACDQLASDGRENAEKKDVLGRAKARAFLQAQGKNKEEREAKADAHYANERLDSYLAESAKEAQLERVRSLRQVVSALQTVANSTKSELDALHYGQDGTP